MSDQTRVAKAKDWTVILVGVGMAILGFLAKNAFDDIRGDIKDATGAIVKMGEQVSNHETRISGNELKNGFMRDRVEEMYRILREIVAPGVYNPKAKERIEKVPDDLEEKLEDLSSSNRRDDEILAEQPESWRNGG